jgi:hypothetical protein
MTTYDEKKQVEAWESMKNKGKMNFFLRHAVIMGIVFPMGLALIELLDHGFSQTTVDAITSLRFLRNIPIGFILGIITAAFTWVGMKETAQKIKNGNG